MMAQNQIGKTIPKQAFRSTQNSFKKLPTILRSEFETNIMDIIISMIIDIVKGCDLYAEYFYADCMRSITNKLVYKKLGIFKKGRDYRYCISI